MPSNVQNKRQCSCLNTRFPPLAPQPTILWYRGKKDKWVKEFQGQLLISTGAIQWTTDCSKALNAIAGGNKTALKALKKKQVSW